VDAVERAGGAAVVGAVPRGKVLYVRGWALDAQGRPGSRILVTLGDADPVEGVTGLARPDVVVSLGLDPQLRPGFAAAFATGTLPAGTHRIQVALEADGRRFRVPSDVSIELGAGDPLDALPVRPEGWAIHLDGVYVGVDRVAGGVDGITLVPDLPAVLRGWAVDVAAQRPLAAVIADDGSGPRAGVVGFSRPDVIDDLGLPGVERCGFAIPLLAPSDAEAVVRIVLASADRGARVDVSLRVCRAPAEGTRGLSLLDGSAVVTIDDVVVGVAPDLGTAVEPGATLHRDELLWVRGWALDAARRAPAAGVMLVVDDEREFVAQAGLERRDVAVANGDAGLVPCGYAGVVPLALFAPGEHRVALRVVAPGASGYWEEAEALRFRIGA
jgi:hypothetical protein